MSESLYTVDLYSAYNKLCGFQLAHYRNSCVLFCPLPQRMDGTVLGSFRQEQVFSTCDYQVGPIPLCNFKSIKAINNNETWRLYGTSKNFSLAVRKMGR